MTALSTNTKLLKFSIACYLSFMAVHFFKFNNTTSIVFSAIFTISSGTNLISCRRYAINRFIVQILGVIIGSTLFFSFKSITIIPPYQNVALSMTLGLLVSLILKDKFLPDVADFTMFTPVFLILLMTPGNSQYPFLRIAYCTIGIAIGYIINSTIYPTNHKIILDKLFLEYEQIFFNIIDDFPNNIIFEEKLINNLQTINNKIYKHLIYLKEDLDINKKYLSIKNEYKKMNLTYLLNTIIIEIFMSLSNSSLENTMSEEYKSNLLLLLNNIFLVHSLILKKITIDEEKFDYKPLLKQTNSYQEIIMLSNITRYYNLIVK